jgi:uncharacterized membrane protein
MDVKSDYLRNKAEKSNIEEDGISERKNARRRIVKQIVEQIGEQIKRHPILMSVLLLIIAPVFLICILFGINEFIIDEYFAFLFILSIIVAVSSHSVQKNNKKELDEYMRRITTKETTKK